MLCVSRVFYLIVFNLSNINVKLYTMKNKKGKIIICAAAAAVNLALFLVKLYIAMVSNSISIYVDSLNSLADSLVLILSFAGFYICLAKPDEKYPFGFGKTEELINVLLSTVILVTGFAFAYTSLQRFMYPVPVWYSVKYAVALLIGAAVKLGLFFVFRASSKKYNSQVFSNLTLDSILDFLISVCIVVSFTLTQRVGYAVDSVMGMAAAAVIIINGIKSVLLSIKTIIGRRDDRLCGECESIIKSFDGIELYSLECHIYGETKIFNADLSFKSDDYSVNNELLNSLCLKIKEQLDAELYINTTGGKI